MARTFPPAALAVLLVVGMQLAATARQLPRVPADIAARAADGSVRVIVGLAVPTQPENLLGDQRAVDAQRASIAAAQDAALDALPGLAEAPTRFATLPAVAVTTDAAGLARLAAMPQVISIEGDYLLGPVLTDTPSLVGANSLWEEGIEGSDWTVAVLDTGVERTHSFFTGRVTAEACFATNDASRNASSLCPSGVASIIGAGTGANCTGNQYCEHGTTVAGVAIGRSGVFSGIARRANLASIKVFSAIGPGSPSCGPAGGAQPACIRAFTSDVIRGLEHVATLAGATNTGRIAAANISLIRQDYETAPDLYSGACDAVSPTMKAAIDNLRTRGIPTIVAAGNDLSDSALPFPACISSAVSVAASSKPTGTTPERIQQFSNRSPALSLVAPGLHIFTSVLNDTYGDRSGTSLAAPHVAGAWALLKSVKPDVSVDVALTALQRTGVRISDGVSATTYPRIVVNKAAGSMGPPGSPTAVLVTTVGSTVTVTWEDPFDGSAPTFTVEFVSATGVVLASTNVGRTHAFTTTLPDATLFVRVVSNTAGVSSNNVPFTVGALPVTRAPSTPTDLRAVVSGQTVALYWNLPFDSTPATAFIVDVGTSSGLSNLGSFDTGSPALSVVAGGVSPGVYYARVRGRNAIGVTGSSNEVMVNVPFAGCAAAPTDLTSTVNGSLVTLTWNPPFQGPVIGYTIEAGTAPGLANVISVPIGTQRSVAANAVSGTFYVRVRTRTNACSVGSPSNEVVVVVP